MENEKDKEAEGHLSEILATAVGTLLQIADLLVPFMPNVAAIIHKTFETGVIVPQEGVLFPKIYLHTPDPHAGTQKPQPQSPSPATEPPTPNPQPTA